jgi:hypothetical protein
MEELARIRMASDAYKYSILDMVGCLPFPAHREVLERLILHSIIMLYLNGYLTPSEWAYAIEGELITLATRIAALDTRVSGHDGKIKAYDERFDKIDKDIKGCKSDLGTQIEDTSKQLEEKVLKAIEAIKTNSPDSGSSKAPPATEPPSNGWIDEPAGLVPYSSNYQSPGGINITNWGPLSIQRASDFRHLSSLSGHENGSPYTGSSGCVSRNGTGFHAAGCTGGSSCDLVWSQSRLLPPIWPGPSSAERRIRNSGYEEGSSNYNYTPHVTLNVERSGGGLFGGPKREQMQLQMGGGGGGGGSGGRKHRSRSNHRIS